MISPAVGNDSVTLRKFCLGYVKGSIAFFKSALYTRKKKSIKNKTIKILSLTFTLLIYNRYILKQQLIYAIYIIKKAKFKVKIGQHTF